jgi:hypothetical protein
VLSPPTSGKASAVARVLILSHKACGWLGPLSSIKYAPRPTMWGVAMEVPEIVLVSVVELIHVDKISEPGAKISTTEPKLE